MRRLEMVIMEIGKGDKEVIAEMETAVEVTVLQECIVLFLTGFSVSSS